MLQADDLDLERIAGFGTLDIDWAGEGVNDAEVQGSKHHMVGSGCDLVGRGFQSIKDNRVARLDMDARRIAVVPKGMGLGIVEMVGNRGTGSHKALLL